MYKEISSNKYKTFFLLAFFFVLVIFLGWGFSWYFGNPSILVFVVIYAVAASWISYFYSDKIVLFISGAKKATREEHFDLYTTVENLAITAGLPRPRVYIIPDPAPNAFATGRNPENAVIVVTTGLLEKLKKPELEGVISHEMAHIGNRDILLATIAVTLVGIVALVSDWGLRWFFWGGGRRRDSNQGGGVMLIVALVLAVLAPIAAKLVQLAISRKREYLADATGSLMTRYPEGLAKALEKISSDKHKIKRINRATAPLFISDPYKKEDKQKSGSFFITLFSTHPPIEKRIKKLREML
jgi:heat shock protein HtpX